MTNGMSALAAHLSYTTPEHREGCTAQGWQVGYRIQTTVRESSYSGHSCPLDADDSGACGHGDSYEALVVRMYCPKCGAATQLNAELPSAPRVFDTTRLGMGIKPRRCGEVWIYQGPPPQLGILLDPPKPPQWYLVARRNALQLTPEDVVGAIEPDIGPRGGTATRSATDSPNFPPRPSESSPPPCSSVTAGWMTCTFRP